MTGPRLHVVEQPVCRCSQPLATAGLPRNSSQSAASHAATRRPRRRHPACGRAGRRARAHRRSRVVVEAVRRPAETLERLRRLLEASASSKPPAPPASRLGQRIPARRWASTTTRLSLMPTGSLQPSDASGQAVITTAGATAHAHIEPGTVDDAEHATPTLRKSTRTRRSRRCKHSTLTILAVEGGSRTSARRTRARGRIRSTGIIPTAPRHGTPGGWHWSPPDNCSRQDGRYPPPAHSERSAS